VTVDTDFIHDIDSDSSSSARQTH